MDVVIRYREAVDGAEWIEQPDVPSYKRSSGVRIAGLTVGALYEVQARTPGSDWSDSAYGTPLPKLVYPSHCTTPVITENQGVIEWDIRPIVDNVGTLYMNGTIARHYGYLDEYRIYHKDRKDDLGWQVTYREQKSISVRSDDSTFEVTRARFAAPYKADLKAGDIFIALFTKSGRFLMSFA